LSFGSFFILVGINDATKEKVAIKLMSKDLLSKEGRKLEEKLKTEISIMQQLNHPNIIKLHSVE